MGMAHSIDRHSNSNLKTDLLTPTIPKEFFVISDGILIIRV